MRCILFAFDTSHVEISPLNDDAAANMNAILVTLNTSHLERSPLNDNAEENIFLISVTADTSQDPIGPCGPWEQSLGESFTHSAMAPCSSVLDFGAHPFKMVIYARFTW